MSEFDEVFRFHMVDSIEIFFKTTKKMTLKSHFEESSSFLL